MHPETEKILKVCKKLGESERIDETLLHSIKLLYSKIHRKLTSTKNHQIVLYNRKTFKDLKLRRRLNLGESEPINHLNFVVLFKSDTPRDQSKTYNYLCTV